MARRIALQMTLLLGLLPVVSIGCAEADSPLGPSDVQSGNPQTRFALRGRIYAETDQSEPVLPGATVILTNAAEERRSAVTGDDGTYVVADLSIGEWTVRVSKTGFVDETIVVDVRGDTTLNFSLAPN